MSMESINFCEFMIFVFPAIMVLAAAGVEQLEPKNRRKNLQVKNRGKPADKPPPMIKLAPEYIEMSVQKEIISDIIPGKQNVKWESIKGLGTAVHFLREAIVMPINNQRFKFTCLEYYLSFGCAKERTIRDFTGANGILLFGPPRSGKTMLMKAVATECKAHFFSISASTIFNKWRGEGGKIVKILFQLATEYAPSIIFFDEIDSIISKRCELSTEHESCQCVKTELLTQMDRLKETKKFVFVFAATNRPWDVDTAMLRHLEIKIRLPLPDGEVRREMCEEILGSRIPAGGAEVLYDFLVEATEGYSASDIIKACREVASRPRRRLMAVLKREQELTPELSELCTITPEDIVGALRDTKPSTTHLEPHRYEEFIQGLPRLVPI